MPLKSSRGQEGLGGADGVLAGHAVGHKEDLSRLHRRLDGRQLLHHRFIHMETAGRIQNHHVTALGPGLGHALLGNLHGINLSHGKHRQTGLTAHGVELGRWPRARTTSAATRMGKRPCFLSCLPSLPTKVVFPEP